MPRTPDSAPEPETSRIPSNPVSSLAAQVNRASDNLTADISLSPDGVSPASDREQYEADVARIRQMRKPFGAYSQKLSLARRVGYHRHWFNDTPGRIDEALSAGWANVKDEKGQPIKRVVGSGRDNGPLLAFAMELPLVFWEEDMAERDKRAKAPMDSIKESPFRAPQGAAKPSDKGKFYSPVEDGPALTIERR